MRPVCILVLCVHVVSLKCKRDFSGLRLLAFQQPQPLSFLVVGTLQNVSTISLSYKIMQPLNKISHVRDTNTITG